MGNTIQWGKAPKVWSVGCVWVSIMSESFMLSFRVCFIWWVIQGLGVAIFLSDIYAKINIVCSDIDPVLFSAWLWDRLAHTAQLEKLHFSGTVQKVYFQIVLEFSATRSVCEYRYISTCIADIFQISDNWITSGLEQDTNIVKHRSSLPSILIWMPSTATASFDKVFPRSGNRTQFTDDTFGNVHRTEKHFRR